MILRALRYIKRLVSRFLGIETQTEHVRALTESIERSNQQSNQQVGALRDQVGALRDQVGLLREQLSALREDVSNLSAAMNNTSGNISLIYDCLLEFDREKRPKAD
jgi:phage shock protein A